MTYDRPALPFGLASLGLHAAMMIALVLLALPRTKPRPRPPVLDVQLIAPTRVQPVATPQTAPASPSEAVPFSAPETESGTVAMKPPSPVAPRPRAPDDAKTGNLDHDFHSVSKENLLAAAVLADRRSQEAVLELQQTSSTDKRELLCGLEAMEQLRNRFADIKPDRMVAYATEETQLEGRLFKAPGAAFRSNYQWYEVNFTCLLSENYSTIEEFKFRLGRPIPRRRWEELNLPPVY